MDSLPRVPNETGGTLAHRIRRQLDALQTYPVFFRDAHGERATYPGAKDRACYLKWKDDEDERRAIDLGPYSRWLIAADLIAENLASGERLRAVLLGERKAEEDAEAKEARDRKEKELLASIFNENSKAFVSASRYDAQQKTDRNEAEYEVLENILKRLNRLFGLRRGAPITRAQFFSVPVPIAEGEVVGVDPLDWFEQWLRWGVGTPASLEPLPDRAWQFDERMLEHITSLLAAPIAEGNHRSIVNVHGRAAHWCRSFAATIAQALDSRGDASSVVRGRRRVAYVSLGLSASPTSIVRDLYRIFALDESRIVDLDSRHVDLAADLAPVRKAITVNNAVIVFGDWDNLEGPFEALHEYLCHRNWGELLRVLAQPLQEAWRSSEDDFCPRGRLLVLSTHPARGVWSWLLACEPLILDAGRGSGPLAGPVAAPASPFEDLLARPRGDVGVAMSFIAASVSGLRRDALRRCMQQWSHLFSDDEWPVDTRFAELEAELQQCREWIVELPDHDYEVVGTSAAPDELEHEPRGRRDAAPQTIRRFVSQELRALFVQTWSRVSPLDPVRRLAGSWSHVNFVLAEESLRQATFLARHVPPGNAENAYAYRRFVQAIYHGLMSLDLPERAFAARATTFGSPFGPTLPTDASKRFRYLYSFLYRHCVENNAWQLGRAFGRSDLRLDVLALFVLPGLGRRMLDRIGGETRRSPFPPPHQVESRQEGCSPYLAADRQLRCEVLEAIGRAATDLGGEEGRAAIEWALSMLPSSETRSAAYALLPERADADPAIADSTLKLRIDWNQSLITSASLKAAEDLCETHLRQHGVPIEPLREAQDRLADVLHLAYADEPGVTRTLQDFLDGLRRSILARLRTGAARRSCAGILARLGEIDATRADFSERPADSGNEARGIGENDALLYARSCALYWLADRVRSAASEVVDGDVTWPLASGRGMRYYIRVCLKLARLISNVKKQNRRLNDLATALLEHAQSRIGLFTRHYFAFPRERVSMLLLEATRIRAWVLVRLAWRRQELEADVARLMRKPGDAGFRLRKGVADAYVGFLQEQSAVLADSLHLLDDGESLLLSLGFQPELVRRLLLDRIKHAIVAADLVDAYRAVQMRDQDHQESRKSARLVAERHAAIARHALSCLRALAERSPFWTEVANRQAKSLDEASRSLQSSND